MATRTEFNRLLKTISPDGTAFSAALKRSVARLGKSELDDVPDLLGDASAGEFDFLRFSKAGGVDFEDGVVPLAFLGTPGSEEPVSQCEGLLLARTVARGGVELFTVEVDGTLVPGTEKEAGKGFAALRLRALAKVKTPKPAKTKTAVPNPASATTSGSPSSLSAFWGELDRHGKAWRTELSRAMDLGNGKAPTDAQLDALLNREEILIYVSGGVIDLTPLRQFRALKTIGLDGFDAIENLQVLRELQSLRGVSLRKSRLKDFSFLAELTALESLTLSQSLLADLSPLRGLTNLTHLDVGHNGVTTLEPLRGLVALRKLVIFHNLIASLEPLVGMSRLEVLLADDNLLAEVGPLANLTHLETVTLEGPFGAGKITSIAPLAGLTALRVLNITSQAVTDVSPLAGCTSLETLQCEVGSGAITGFHALLGLKSLQKIVTHASLISKKDRDAFKKSRPDVKIALL